MNYCEFRISVKLNITLDEGDFDSLNERLDSASFCARTSLESNFMAHDPTVEVSVAVEEANTYYTIKAKNLNLEAKEHTAQLKQYEELFDDKYQIQKAIYFTAQGCLVLL